METQQRILCRRELPFGHQPAFITKRKTGYLIRQLQLQLLASVGQRRTELKKMPLYQAGGCSDGHNDLLVQTDGSLAQGSEFLLMMC